MNVDVTVITFSLDLQFQHSLAQGNLATISHELPDLFSSYAFAKRGSIKQFILQSHKIHKLNATSQGIKRLYLSIAKYKGKFLSTTSGR